MDFSRDSKIPNLINLCCQLNFKVAIDTFSMIFSLKTCKVGCTISQNCFPRRRNQHHVSFSRFLPHNLVFVGFQIKTSRNAQVTGNTLQQIHLEVRCNKSKKTSFLCALSDSAISKLLFNSDPSLSFDQSTKSGIFHQIILRCFWANMC